MSNTIRKLMLGLMLFSAGYAGTAVYAQNSVGVVNADTRIPVMLRPSDRTRVLNDMRQYLKGMQEIFSALAQDDMAKIASTARTLGKINIYDPRLMVPSKSSATFHELSTLVHRDFESLAEDAEKLSGTKTNPNIRDTMERLSQTMKKCVACHETFRLTDKPHSGSEAP